MMKKIISLLSAFLIILSSISCNEGEKPVNTADTSIKNPEISDTKPADGIKIFDFNEREKVENIYITLDDLKKLYAEAESIYCEYDIVRGKVQKHTYPLEFETYKGAPTFEYYDIEIVPNHDIFEKVRARDNSLNRKEAADCCTDVCKIFMMNVTSFCKEGMVLSEYSEDGLAWTHGSGIARTHWYSILLNSDMVPNEPKDICKSKDILLITMLVNIVTPIPKLNIRDKNDMSLETIEMSEGLNNYIRSLS